MKKVILKSLVLTIGVSMFVGCSTKPPKPVQLDNGSAITLNQGLIDSRLHNVPKDPFLKDENWTYQIVAEKKGEYLLKNGQVAKFFYVAHNAQEIIIIGDKNLIKEYQKYLLENQVTAHIKLQPVRLAKVNQNIVNMLFFSQKKSK